MGFIIFSDLDGTLLDHHGYGWRAALPALHRLRREGWPLIPVTSKTRAEVLSLYGPLGLRDPIVVENGGGIFLPGRAPWDAMGEIVAAPLPADPADPADPDDPRAGTRHRSVDPLLPRGHTLGVPHETLRAFMRREGHALGMRGFSDMPVDEVARRTGLDPASARRACARDFSEPFVLDDARDLAEVRRHAAAAGLAVTTGGRFHHLIGAHQSKGRAVGLLIEIWREGGGADDVSVSLGDGENDIPMLEQTDVAIRVPAPPRPLPMLNRSDSIVAPAPGPAGWSAALLELFDAPPADAPPADPSPAGPSPAPDSAGPAPDSS